MNQLRNEIMGVITAILVRNVNEGTNEVEVNNDSIIVINNETNGGSHLVHDNSVTNMHARVCAKNVFQGVAKKSNNLATHGGTSFKGELMEAKTHVGL